MTLPDPVDAAGSAARSRRHAKYAVLIIPLSCVVIYVGMGTKEPGKTPLLLALIVMSLAQLGLGSSAFVAALAARRAGNHDGSALAGAVLAVGAVLGGLMGAFMMVLGNSGRGY